MRNALRSLWTEPRAPLPTTPAWWDRVLVAVLVPAALLEGVLREDLTWRPITLLLGAGLAFTLLWRRSSPFVAFVVAFGAPLVVKLVALVRGSEWTELDTTAYLLLLPYSLFRWGAGREAAIGLVLMLVSYSLTALRLTSVSEVIGGGVVLLFPAVLGSSVRFRANAWLRELDQVKLLEREQLARELHDTVAHHVSAIAVQAQAGRALAAVRSHAAADALEVIEEAAARALTDLRDMVRTLRQDDAADLTPQPGVADLERLAWSAGDKLPVDVELSGDLDNLRPSVDAAIYRLARESITNAVRHARHATRVSVRVFGDDDSVRLTVSDDGDPGPVGANVSSGFGLVGMTERATLLGGTLEAGPNADRGWTVEAVLLRKGTTR